MVQVVQKQEQTSRCIAQEDVLIFIRGGHGMLYRARQLVAEKKNGDILFGLSAANCRKKIQGATATLNIEGHKHSELTAFRAGRVTILANEKRPLSYICGIGQRASRAVLGYIQKCQWDPE